MSPAERLFDPSGAFDHPVTVWVAAGGAFLVAASGLLVTALSGAGAISESLRKDLNARIRTWGFLLPAMIGPILLGAAWVIAAVLALSLASYREYARATGLFRERFTSLVVVAGILAVTFAVADHWYDFFVALSPLSISLIAAVSILGDRPQGYIQRTALGIFGFALFGAGFGHLAYFANDAQFRPILSWLVAGVAMNDVFPYVVGKAIGRRPLAPKTSPHKTIEGAVGALVLTTAFVAVLGHFTFRGGDLDRPLHLITLGLIVSVGGQLGDLMLSSIKRDVGVKDMGSALPGHGGVLDRFTSFLIVSPAVFHYVGYVTGVGLSEPTRILSGP
jgi:phosphatidate cytidylyltransferase